MSPSKEIAVVGAGVSGLAAVKACVEVGMLPTCYEQSLDIGGLWNISDDSGVHRVTVTESTTFNTSKEMSCFSDFPMPRDFQIMLTMHISCVTFTLTSSNFIWLSTYFFIPL